MEVKIKKARLSFPFLHATDKNGIYRCALILDPVEHADEISQLNAAIEAAKKIKWPNVVPPKLKISALKDGNLEGRSEVKGKWICQASNKVQPGLFDIDKKPLSPTSGKPYSGCYVHAIVDVHAWDNTDGVGVRAELRGVKFAEHGDAFAGGIAAEASAFDGFGDDDDTFNM